MPHLKPLHVVSLSLVLLAPAGMLGCKGKGQAAKASGPAVSIGAAPGQDAGPLAAEIKALPPVGRAELRERALAMLNEMAFGEAPELRAQALEGLWPTPARAEPVARALLADPNPGVRYAAAVTVGRLRLDNLGASVRPLLADADLSVRGSAAYALARLRQSGDESVLARVLEQADPMVASRAAYLLGELGNASAVPMLRDAAKQRRGGSDAANLIFRIQVAEALVKLGDREGIHPIRAALFPAEAWQLEGSTLAIATLGTLRDNAVTSELVRVIREKAPNAPANAEGGFLWPPEMRLAAAASLGRLGQGVFGRVGDEYAKSPNAALRAQVAFVYAAGGAAGLERLRVLMADGSPLVRSAAAAGVLRVVEGR
ncbi:MAG: HEAT repeat domain-containing protein [Phycisphaerales bacterium]|nr:HEAT repeat domain-containing protein [Phycisphaerales bacterium]